MSNIRSDGPDDSDLAGLYALDALEGEELERFEQLMAADPEVRAEVQGFRETAARLASATAEPAPRSMRQDVLGQLGNIRQDPVRLDAERARRRQGAARRVAAVAAAALLLAGVGLGGYLIGAGGSSDEVAQEADGLVDVLTYDDARIVQLDGEAAESARLVYTADGGRAVVVADGMAAPPDGYVYELWQVRGDEAVNVGLFSPDEAGTVRSAAAVGFASGDVVGVTVEPEGGSDVPTSPMVLSAEL